MPGAKVAKCRCLCGAVVARSSIYIITRRFWQGLLLFLPQSGGRPGDRPESTRAYIFNCLQSISNYHRIDGNGKATERGLCSNLTGFRGCRCQLIQLALSLQQQQAAVPLGTSFWRCNTEKWHCHNRAVVTPPGQGSHQAAAAHWLSLDRALARGASLAQSLTARSTTNWPPYPPFLRLPSAAPLHLRLPLSPYGWILTFTLSHTARTTIRLALEYDLLLVDK